MQGAASLHKRTVFQPYAPSTANSCVTACLEDLLLHQYVRDPHTGALYWVAQGSGQGQITSGDISDSTFYALVEHDYAVDASVCSNHGVLGYARYRDDIIIAARPGDEIRNFFNGMRSRCRDVYKLTCSKVASTECEFLDFYIYKGRKFGISRQVE